MNLEYVPSKHVCSVQVKTLLKLYSKEKYILVVKQKGSDFEVFISFKVHSNYMWGFMWNYAFQCS